MRALALAAAVSAASAHVCLLHPMQRGGANVSDAGDDSCFEPNACTRASGAPTATLVAGHGTHVLLQQNLNHYNPGWPGFIDISWATLEGSKVGNWSVLARVPDYWAHLQAAQTNFTVPVLVPETACAACVLRVRYSPNKPTEVVFHACADVSAVAAPAPPAPAGAVLALASAGAPRSAASQAVAVARLAPSGEVSVIAAPPAGVQLLAGVSASLGGALFTLARNASAAAAAAGGAPPPASLLVRVAGDGAGGATVAPITLPAGDAEPPQAWVALSAVAAGWAAPALVLVGIAPSQEAGFFTYQARLLDAATGAASAVLARSAPENTFVNVFQVTAARASSATSADLYLLAGDENSLYALNAAVFSLRLDTGGGAPAAMARAVLDNSAWTLGNLHLGRGGALLGVSPGLYAVGNASAADWALVRVDAASGAVARVGPIAAANGFFAPWYGGAVYGDEPAGGATLLHIFQHALDGSFVLATIDAATGALSAAPTLLNGVDNELLFDTPVFVAGA
jgi:hypothetical protein